MLDTDFPDINVWLAIVDEGHLHHERAGRYWKSEKASMLAWHDVTMFGLLRMLTSRHVMAERVLPPAQAWRIGQDLDRRPDVMRVADGSQLAARFESWTRSTFFTPKLWTDAWIAALALEHGCRVVSFDADFTKFPGLNLLHLKI